MGVDDWRRHVRYFTKDDVETMIRASGLSVVSTKYMHCVYNAFHEDYFHEPIPKISQWKLDLILPYGQFRSDMSLVGEKLNSEG